MSNHSFSPILIPFNLSTSPISPICLSWRSPYPFNLPSDALHPGKSLFHRRLPLTDPLEADVFLDARHGLSGRSRSFFAHGQSGVFQVTYAGVCGGGGW